ncbi:MAG: type II secretion system protein [Bacillota bacterium]
MKKLKSARSSNAGFTIVEGLIGFLLIAIVSSSFIGGIVAMQKLRMNTDDDRILNKQINDIIESIRPNLKMYQLSYDNSKTNAERLDLGTLPMAWGNGLQVRASDCSSCPGRYGYVIQSYEGYYGIYLVTLRFSHKDWATKKGTTNPAEFGYVDYEFVVNVQ